MNQPAPDLALKDVSKSFGAVPALRDVSPRLFPGEAHALAGPGVGSDHRRRG
ncbi:hypothetical protein [Streptomyces lushanensis]|uniref:hypothetical protein n=1 Tax=Streptomyces lushanensis TaxID=1434255 RepID=UPI001473090A|nr:hypothetical protein [Streptomyces lushanensis]